MKTIKLEIFCIKISLTGCKWSRMNAPGTETPVSHSPLAHCVLQELSQFPDLFWPTKPHSTFTLTLGLAYYAIHRIRDRDNFLLEGIFDVGRDFSASSSSPSWDYRYTAALRDPLSTFRLQWSCRICQDYWRWVCVMRFNTRLSLTFEIVYPVVNK